MREGDFATDLTVVMVTLYDLVLVSSKVRAHETQRRRVEEESYSHTPLVASVTRHPSFH